MKARFLLPILLLAACGEPEPTSLDQPIVSVPDQPEAPNPSTGSGTGGDAGAGKAAKTEIGMAPKPPVQAEPRPAGQPIEPPSKLSSIELPPLDQKPLAPPLQMNYTPKQDGSFGFETDAISDAALADFHVVMDVTIDGEAVGSMTFVFWPEKAPVTVRNFLRYCDEGFYDDKIYHRVMRDFMIQGGSSNNTASGKGPHGLIKGEFSEDPKYTHRYGVLSMARGNDPDSASSQYFVITDSDAPSVKALDGNYASFGILSHGVSTLEAIAEVKTTMNPLSGEMSKPTRRIVVTEARVVQGKPEVTEEAKRPPFDLKGEAPRVKIQHVLISFKGTGTQATRSKEEAEALAKEVLQKAQGGADFDQLVKDYTDDTSGVTADPPGHYQLLNTRQTPGYSEEEQKAITELEKAERLLQEKLIAEVNAGTKTMDKAKAEFFASDVVKRSSAYRWIDRAAMVKNFGDAAFSLQVGEFGMAEYHPRDGRFGWHILYRYE